MVSPTVFDISTSINGNGVSRCLMRQRLKLRRQLISFVISLLIRVVYSLESTDSICIAMLNKDYLGKPQKRRDEFNERPVYQRKPPDSGQIQCSK